MINVHASLLPRYRGAAPVHRAVINGECETGVTIMRVERRLDAGPMFATSVRPIGPDGTSQEVAQDDSLSTHAARLTKDEGLIDWSLPASDIHNRVRGLHPWPHAYTYLGPARLIVLKTRVEQTTTDTVPGTIVDITRDALHVATGQQGRIAVEQVQREGGRPLHTRDFLTGHDVAAGARLDGPQHAAPVR
jgi:methionyl-tRNA formyltransferase